MFTLTVETSTKVVGKTTVSTVKGPWFTTMETSTKVIGKTTVSTVKESWFTLMEDSSKASGTETIRKKEPCSTPMETSSQASGQNIASIRMPEPWSTPMETSSWFRTVHGMRGRSFNGVTESIPGVQEKHLKVSGRIRKTMPMEL